MKKIVISLFLILGIGSGLFLTQYLFPEDSDAIENRLQGATSNSSISGVVEPTPIDVPLAVPVSISIPRLGKVETVIEHVGLDPEGKMDVPKIDDNVAWFDLGYRPGAIGNSVIAGHFDTKAGTPAVFYELNSMEIGDEFYVYSDDGQVKTFRVTDKIAYPYNEFPTEFVFGKSEKKMLNLITCDGTWDAVNGTYSNRLVIFSELAE